MVFGRRPPLEPRDDGSIVIGLGDGERELLGHLLSQLRMLVRAESTGDADPTSPVRRLFPTAHPHDVDREADYQEMVHDTLVEQRLTAIETVEQTLESDTLTPEHADTWMRVLNDLRLVVGTRLDVSEDEIVIDPDDPEAELYAVYDFLGFLVDRLVRALLPTLPDDPRTV